MATQVRALAIKHVPSQDVYRKLFRKQVITHLLSYLFATMLCTILMPVILRLMDIQPIHFLEGLAFFSFALAIFPARYYVRRSGMVQDTFPYLKNNPVWHAVYHPEKRKFSIYPVNPAEAFVWNIQPQLVSNAAEVLDVMTIVHKGVDVRNFDDLLRSFFPERISRTLYVYQSSEEFPPKFSKVAEIDEYRNITHFRQG